MSENTKTEGGSIDHRPRPRLRTRAGIVLGVVVGVLAASVAAAAVGAFDVGSTIPGDERTKPAQNDLAVDETVLATGESDVGGPWRITSYNSEGIEDGGRVIEPEGLDCLRLALITPSAKGPLGWSGFCGETGNGGFAAGSVPVTDGSGGAALILFGPAPPAADRVALRGPDGTMGASTSTSDDPSRPRTIWALEVTSGLSGASLVWLDERGEASKLTIDADDFKDRLAIARQID